MQSLEATCRIFLKVPEVPHDGWAAPVTGRNNYSIFQLIFRHPLHGGVVGNRRLFRLTTR